MAESNRSSQAQGSSWAAAIVVVVQGAVLIGLIGAPVTGSEWLAWAAMACMTFAWVVQWSGWVLARRNLALMPLFGTGELSSESVPESLPGVALIAPARNEENGIESALRSMAAIDYPTLEVIVVDDHSTDATPEILDRLARDLPKLRVMHDPLPQPGWLGKLNAVRHAVQQVSPKTKWLLFTDADIVFGPTVLKDAIVFVERQNIDFLTCMPYLEMDSLLEELVLLSGWLRHLDWVQYPRLNDPKSRTVGIGAFMLVRRRVYDSSGGHEAIAGEACDDVALAASLKKNGAKMGFGWAGHQLRCHQYHGYRDMMSSLVRKQRIAFKDNLWAFLCTAEYLIIQSVLPLPLALGGAAVQFWRQDFSVAVTALSVMAFVMYIQGALGYAVGRAFCRIHAAAPYLHPVAGVLRAWICVRGIGQKLARKPLDWRGRALETT